MSAAISTVKLHFNKREISFLVPLYTIGVVAVLSVLITVVIWRAGSVPGSAEWIEGSRNNPGIAYALVSFLGYLGVQAVATTFPFALTLGATRRSFVAGTLLWSVLTSAYITAVIAVLAAIEIATDHWFADFYIFDVYVLGAGDFGKLIPIVFLGILTLFAIAGLFSASWLRLGSRGPIALALLVVLVIVGVLLVLIPSAATLLEGFQLWWLAVMAIAIVIVSATGTWLFLRSATVR
jgi:hypothetical protein